MTIFGNGNTQTLQFEARCRFCKDPEDPTRGKLVAKTPSLNIPVIGQPGKMVQDYLAVLFKHLTKHHPDKLAYGSAVVQEMQAFLIMAAFEHEEPSLTQRIEAMRAMLFALVRKNTFGDAEIQHVIAGFGLDREDAAKVEEAMKALRDACCELGPFAPRVPEKSPLVAL